MKTTETCGLPVHSLSQSESFRGQNSRGSAYQAVDADRCARDETRSGSGSLWCAASGRWRVTSLRYMLSRRFVITVPSFSVSTRCLAFAARSSQYCASSSRRMAAFANSSGESAITQMLAPPSFARPSAPMEVDTAGIPAAKASEQLDAYARTAANWANKYSVASERSTDVFNVTSEADIRVAREETEFLRRFRTHDHQLCFRFHSGDPRQDLGYHPSQGFHVRFMTKTADEKQCVRFAAVPRVPVMPGLNASPKVRIEAFLQRRQKLPQICRVVLSAYLHPGHLRKRTEFVAQRSEILQPVRYKFSDAGQPVHRPGYALKIEIMFKKETGNVFVFACILRKLRVFKLHNIDVILIQNPV